MNKLRGYLLPLKVSHCLGQCDITYQKYFRLTLNNKYIYCTCIFLKTEKNFCISFTVRFEVYGNNNRLTTNRETTRGRSILIASFPLSWMAWCLRGGSRWCTWPRSRETSTAQRWRRKPRTWPGRKVLSWASSSCPPHRRSLRKEQTSERGLRPALPIPSTP